MNVHVYKIYQNDLSPPTKIGHCPQCLQRGSRNERCTWDKRDKDVQQCQSTNVFFLVFYNKKKRKTNLKSGKKEEDHRI